MSLSKYFKDSSSFKKEDIVKTGAGRDEGWKTDSKSPSEPFAPEKVERNAPKSAPPPPPAPPKNRIPNGNQNDSRVAANQPAPPPAEPSIDLSKYISNEEAEEKSRLSYQEGIQAGLQKAAEDYSSATSAFNTSCQQLDSIRETIINNSSRELLEFALLIAEKIIRISIKEQDQTIVATIEEALHRAVKSEEFTIFLNPADYDIISAKSEDLIASVSGLTNIVIKTDPTIEQGGAKIESENCIIDATISSQFEAIRDELHPDTNS